MRCWFAAAVALAALAPPTPKAAPDPVDLGELYEGQVVTRPLTVRNPGKETLRVEGFHIC